MKELLNRLTRRPALTAQLLAVSLAANLLALASPLFVTLVLSRYVSYGVDATLYTLTSGVIIAIALEFAFRAVRLGLANDLNSDIDLSIGAYGMLLRARSEALDRMPPSERHILRSLDLVSSAFSASNLCSLLDVPFALLFLGVLTLVSPILGLIAGLFIGAVFAIRVANERTHGRQSQQIEQITALGGGILNSTNRSPETARMFDAAGWLLQGWSRFVHAITNTRVQVQQRQGLSDLSLGVAQALLTVAIIGVGATFVVVGKLDVSALIGANILAARALAPVARFVQIGAALQHGERALARLRALAEIETEQGHREGSDPCCGAIKLQDVSFAYAGLSSPLFEALDLSIAAGSIVVVKGANGAGKTTFLRMLLGLVLPTRGKILIDNVELRQISAAWWRKQVSYAPQEMHFLDGTILENLSAANPDLDEAGLRDAIEEAGLGQYINESPNGLRTTLVGSASNLSLGLRRRLTLARAFATIRPIVVLDEPTEGLDNEGRSRVYRIMNRASQAGRTIIVASDDAYIVKAAHIILDLDQKPKPGLRNLRLAATAGEAS